jgi:peptidyl-prolyl cis-trans isomerase C
MFRQSIPLLAAVALTLTSVPAFAQTPPPPAPTAPMTNAIAATVNGRPISENAVQRALERVPVARRAEGRAQILDFLIDNELIEQYLQQMQTAVDPKDVEKKMDEAKADIKRAGKDWDAWLKSRLMTEADLRQVFTEDMRWDKYTLTVANDQVLRSFFEANRDQFDGTQVHARHVFLSSQDKNEAQCQQAVAALREMKQQIDLTVAEEMKTLAADTKAPEREAARRQMLDKAFAEMAKAKSECESRKEGGDLHFFPRVSTMVEPFAKAAFALKLFEMSDVVQSPFGYHLILVVERMGTRDVKFEDVKSAVLEVYADKKRDEMVSEARKKSRIEIAPLAKP